MISLVDVTKVYPRKGAEDVRALDGINLTIPSGDIHGIVGESGAGKSTLIRCLTALERPTSGKILVDGEDLASLPTGQLRRARRNIGMVFQGANLLDARTSRENIAIPLRFSSLSHVKRQEGIAKILRFLSFGRYSPSDLPASGLSREEQRERVNELLELVGLSERGTSYPSQLSGGQRQRVGIARALADNPSVLLCDEPTSALDTETTNQILNLLKDVRDRYGVTVIIITHEMSVVRQICDSVTLLEEGRVTATGSVADVVANIDSPLARQIVPLPDLDPSLAKGQLILDIAFTSVPGTPTGARVLDLAREINADIGAGTFETLGSTQAARLALTLPLEKVDKAIAAFENAGVVARVREQ